jgi:F0F1-type ATP synthase delta subunit
MLRYELDLDEIEEEKLNRLIGDPNATHGDRAEKLEQICEKSIREWAKERFLSMVDRKEFH